MEAERFKADVTQPRGNALWTYNKNLGLPGQFKGLNVSKKVPNDGYVIDDDEFFHVSCHVDKVLTERIERGKYVDLERLLLKEKHQRGKEDDRLEFVNHEGHTYLAPVQSDAKINGVCKWEQAFRVYAAIYSKANPHRAAEIWQYVHIINMAAATYVWDNVSYYDFTFRQMMSVNSNRSWAKIFNQLWNLAMCNPIQKQGNQYGGNNSYNGSRPQSQGRRKSSKACWQFNKNQSCNAATCGFEHKCSYCGSQSHSVLDCPKLANKRKQDRDGYHSSHSHGSHGNHRSASPNQNNNNNTKQ